MANEREKWKLAYAGLVDPKQAPLLKVSRFQHSNTRLI